MAIACIAQRFVSANGSGLHRFDVTMWLSTGLLPRTEGNARAAFCPQAVFEVVDQLRIVS